MFIFIIYHILNKYEFTCFYLFRKFQFKDIIAEVGDFVLISNADAAEPDTEGGCDAARILLLYEDTSNNNDPFRAKVQWYSRHNDLPKECLNHCDNIKFLDKEVISLIICYNIFM